MASKEYIGLARITQAFQLLKSKLDLKADNATQISYADFMQLTPQEQESGNWLVIGMPSPSGGGGHVIEDSSGTEMAQEPTMQFVDAHVTDDSTNGKTVVETIKSVTYSQWEALQATTANEGTYIITDGQGGSGIDADDVSFDNTGTGMSSTNAGDAIRELNAEIADLDNDVTIGTSVSISPSTTYKTPSDGYLALTSNADSATSAYLRNGNNVNFAVHTCYNKSVATSLSIYVRKGINIYVTYTSGQGTAKFTPTTV